MFSDLLRIPIVTPAVLVPVDAAAAALVVLVLVLGIRRRRRPDRGRTITPRRRPIRRVLVELGAMLVGAAIGLALVWFVGDVENAFGVTFTPATRMWVAFLFAGVGLMIAVLVHGDWNRRILVVGTAALVALASGLGINVDFGAYRTIEQAITTNPYPERGLGPEHAAVAGAQVVDPADWHSPAHMPERGETISVRIPATVSHFSARRAVVWLPPAARVADPPVLPVIVSLSGQPGEPSDMFTSGELGHDLDAYASAHHGLAPIVVAPDQLGAPNRNPMCLDSRALGKSNTYLMTDTVHWITAHLDVASAPSAWSITGFSEGATCAMQLSTAHPGVFGSALAISSELAPVTGSRQHTIDLVFHGSAAAYRRATPLAIMRAHTPYRDHLTVFAYGSADTRYRRSTTILRAGAVAAGMQTQLVVSPGSAHDWNTVRYALVAGLPSIIAHMGLDR